MSAELVSPVASLLGHLLTMSSHGLPSLCMHTYCVHAHVVSKLFLKGDQSDWMRAHCNGLNLTESPLSRPHLQILSHSEVLGLGLNLNMGGGDIIQPITEGFNAFNQESKARENFHPWDKCEQNFAWE